MEDVDRTGRALEVSLLGHQRPVLLLVVKLVNSVCRSDVLDQAAVVAESVAANLAVVLALVGPTNRRMGLGHPAMDPQL